VDQDVPKNLLMHSLIIPIVIHILLEENNYEEKDKCGRELILEFVIHSLKKLKNFQMRIILNPQISKLMNGNKEKEVIIRERIDHQERYGCEERDNCR